MLEEIIVVKSDRIVGVRKHGDLQAAGEGMVLVGDNPVVLIQDPLFSNELPDLKNFIAVAFHDIVPSSLRAIELSGLTPFDTMLAKRIINFVEPFYHSQGASRLYVACPHGRARGNSVAAGLNLIFPSSITGSVSPESINTYIVEIFRTVGLEAGVDRNVFVAGRR